MGFSTIEQISSIVGMFLTLIIGLISLLSFAILAILLTSDKIKTQTAQITGFVIFVFAVMSILIIYVGVGIVCII